MTRAEIFAAIEAERERQKVVHPESEQLDALQVPNGDYRHELAGAAIAFKGMSIIQPRNPALILLSEVYEVMSSQGAEDLRRELIQVAAVCLKWLECLPLEVRAAEAKAKAKNRGQD